MEMVFPPHCPAGPTCTTALLMGLPRGTDPTSITQSQALAQHSCLEWTGHNHKEQRWPQHRAPLPAHHHKSTLRCTGSFKSVVENVSVQFCQLQVKHQVCDRNNYVAKNLQYRLSKLSKQKYLLLGGLVKKHLKIANISNKYVPSRCTVLPLSIKVSPRKNQVHDKNISGITENNKQIGPSLGLLLQTKHIASGHLDK